MRPARPDRWKVAIAGSLGAILVAGLGGALTEIGPWYLSLAVPPWKPPDWAFGPIWTTILALTVVSGVIAYMNESSRARRQWMIGLFTLNGLLNIFWSLLFFTLHRPDWSLVEAGCFWLSILALIAFLYRSSPLSSALILPYIVWVSIATLLNYEIVALNGSFG